jgi:hypothetical protein
VQQPLVFRPPASEVSSSLVVREIPARLKALMAEQDKWLARATKKRAQLASLVADGRDAQSRIAVEVTSLLETTNRLSEDIPRLFDALASDPKRSRRERKEIALLRKGLELGILSEVSNFFDEAPPWVTASYPSRGKRSPGSRSARASATPDTAGSHPPSGAPGETADASPSFVAPAEARPGGRDHGALRTLFRRLAEALHPDKVQDENDRASRTEIMKRVTAAYQAGDFASLVEIERSHGAPRSFAADADEDEQARALVGAIEVLRNQVRALDKELRAARAMNPKSIGHELGDLRQGVEELQTLHDFVVSFRDGKITFDAFCAGPPGMDRDADCDEELDMLVALQELLAEAVDHGPNPTAKRRKRRKRP